MPPALGIQKHFRECRSIMQMHVAESSENRRERSALSRRHVSVLLVIGVTALTVTSWLWARGQLSALQDFHQVAPAKSNPGQPAKPPPATYVQSLPAAHLAPQLATRIHERMRDIAARLGDELVHSQVDVSLAAAPASITAGPARIGRITFAVTLRGNYPAVKAALDELLQRSQPALMPELSIEGLGTTAQPGAIVEARAVMWLPLRPGA